MTAQGGRSISSALSVMGLTHLLTDELLLPVLIEGVRGVLFDPPSTRLSDACSFASKVIQLQYLECPVAREYAFELLKRQDVADVLTLGRLTRSVQELDQQVFADIVAAHKGKSEEVAFLSRSDNACRISLVWRGTHGPFVWGERYVDFGYETVFRWESSTYTESRPYVHWSFAKRRFGVPWMTNDPFSEIARTLTQYEDAMAHRDRVRKACGS